MGEERRRNKAGLRLGRQLTGSGRCSATHCQGEEEDGVVDAQNLASALACKAIVHLQQANQRARIVQNQPCAVGARLQLSTGYRPDSIKPNSPARKRGLRPAGLAETRLLQLLPWPTGSAAAPGRPRVLRATRERRFRGGAAKRGRVQSELSSSRREWVPVSNLSRKPHLEGTLACSAGSLGGCITGIERGCGEAGLHWERQESKQHTSNGLTGTGEGQTPAAGGECGLHRCGLVDGGQGERSKSRYMWVCSAKGRVDSKIREIGPMQLWHAGALSQGWFARRRKPWAPTDHPRQ